MDDANYIPKAAQKIIEAKLLDSEPFMLFDVGCSGGIHERWRILGNNLHAHAFDPNFGEIDRLRLAEASPNVHYHANYIGLPDDHEFRRSKADAEARYRISYTDFVHSRSSAWEHRNILKPSITPALSQEWAGNSPSKFGLAEFAQRNAIKSVDFVKVDTDGADLEALYSLETCLKEAGVLGFEIECVYQGSDHFTSNTFHNIDRFMKRHGFMLYGMSVFRYSRQALPSRYLYNFPAQTFSGQPLWGDVLFLRDLPWDAECGSPETSIGKLLKMICLFDLFQLPDCAAELIVNHREGLDTIISSDTLLDLLTPSVDGRTLSYQDYCHAVSANPLMLFPSPPRSPEPGSDA